MSDRPKRPTWALVALSPALVCLCTCSRKPAQAAGGDPGVVAELNGVAITQADVEARAGSALLAVRQQEYETRRKAIDEIVIEKLLDKEAASRKLTTAQLLEAEVDGKVPKPSQEAIDSTYEAYKVQLRGQTKEQVTPDIEGFLHRQGVAKRREEFERELKQKASLRVHLAPPRWEVKVPASAPALGPPEAGVTIVEYLDYQCPYCKRAQTTVDEILRLYDKKVRFVHRDFPIEGHPGALPAARAARCAEDQGKFWDYHRNLFSAGGDFGPKDLGDRAAALGLNAQTFATCMSSNRHDADIKASANAGQQLGVNSTPTFFINGRRIAGALPLNRFQELIDEELAAAGRAAN